MDGVDVDGGYRLCAKSGRCGGLKWPEPEAVTTMKCQEGAVAEPGGACGPGEGPGSLAGDMWAALTWAAGTGCVQSLGAVAG